MILHSCNTLVALLLLLVLLVRSSVHACSSRSWRASFALSRTSIPLYATDGKSLLLKIRGGDIVHPASLLELDDILEESKDKLVVIDFFSTDCAPCEKIAPLYEELSQSEEFSKNVVFLKVNVDNHPFITAKYSVTGWPTFLFIKNGQVQTEIVGGKLAEATLYDWVRLLMPKEEKEDD